MDTKALKKFAPEARTLLLQQVTAQLDRVLDSASAARREQPQAVKELEADIGRSSKPQVIEQVAYTWFNRFSALRFMDVNGYNLVRCVSSAKGATQPEILSEALAGNLPEDASPGHREAIAALLEGRAPSHDPQGEAYRRLLVWACNEWHRRMPFLFEPLDDYSELLLPEDLLSPRSILARLRQVMTEQACQEVEIIGWLYQFYNSERKDQVSAAKKKGQKIRPEDIPAVTQLFTPHWIVRYLVENSLGQLWLLNRPESRLAEQMDYYIAPENLSEPPETEVLKVDRPEEIKVCDPACGSGHMLTYAFDLLYAIYAEQGYPPAEIPTLILTHNLHGIEIDDRAAMLAGFALMMKAAAKLGRRQFLRMTAQPKICVMQNVAFTETELADLADLVGEEQWTAALHETCTQFQRAKTFGALIQPKLTDPAAPLRAVEALDLGGDLLWTGLRNRLRCVLHMAEALSTKYYVVVTNPPYMGRKAMNAQLSAFLTKHYKKVSYDLFSAFVIRNCSMTFPAGHLGFVTPIVWMFKSSYQDLRRFLLNRKTIASLIQLEYSGFDGATVPVCTFTLENRHRPEFRAAYVQLTQFRGTHVQGPQALKAIQDPNCGWFYRTPATTFDALPGSRIAYWASEQQKKALAERQKLGQWSEIKKGLTTANTNRFLRLWHEVSISKIGFGYSSTAKTTSGDHKWYPHNKGGKYRCWYGNFEYVVNWEHDGSEIRNFTDKTGRIRSAVRNTRFYFKEGVTWTYLSSSKFGARYAPPGLMFDATGSSAFPPDGYAKQLCGALVSKVTSKFLSFLNPTLSFEVGDIANLPFDQSVISAIDGTTQAEAIELAKSDWDAYERSWDFTTLPLLTPQHDGATLEATYDRLCAHWQAQTDAMRRLEEDNNRIFIHAYGLQDEIQPEVPIEDITLTCNPAYRYGVKGSAADREARLRTDTLTELISYAVGCLFGRYSLDQPGLILADQGTTLEDYRSRVPNPRLLPDEDNVIPILDAAWFPDDMTDRFRSFLRLTFGEAQLQENLRFIEQALGKDIRKYFLKDFYADHVQRYRKRPIYWLFSSPKGTFNALVYLHRYRSDTVSVLLNDYLRALIDKLAAEHARLERRADDPAERQGQRTKAQKNATKIAAQISELGDWERDVVFPLAQQRIALNLDDGVKANYRKFGSALKKIPGLD